MEERLVSLFANYEFAAIALGVIFVLAAALKVLKGALDFQYEYFTRRHLRRVVELTPLIDEAGALHRYAKSVVESEVFRIISKVKVPPRKATALMFLCDHNRISPMQMKGAASYVTARDDGSIDVILSALDKVGAVLSFVSSLTVFGYGSVIFLVLFFQGGLSMLLGALLFLMFSLATRLISGEVRRYRAAKNLQASLRQMPLPVCLDLVVRTYPLEKNSVAVEDSSLFASESG